MALALRASSNGLGPRATRPNLIPSIQFTGIRAAKTTSVYCSMPRTITKFSEDRGEQPSQHAMAGYAQADMPDEELDRKCTQAAIDLQEHGWAVVEGVLPESACSSYIEGLWDYLERLGTGIDRNDPSTWGPDRFPPTYRGILNTLEVGHQAFVWAVRKHPRLLKLFGSLWGTNELLTSFDAINMLGPHNESPSGGWLHVDQAPVHRGLACIQGIVNLTANGPDVTGTLMVKDKSFKAHQDFFHNVSGMSQEELDKVPDHYQFKNDKEVSYWDKYESVKLSGGAGSVFLWDSRTVHSNTAPDIIKQWRHVVYACYQPRSMASDNDLRLKKKAWDEHSITTHLPAQNIRIYDAEFAKLYPNEAKVMDVKGLPDFQVSCDRASIEDANMRRLAGIEPYPAEEVQTFTPLMKVPVEELRAKLGEPAKASA